MPFPDVARAFASRATVMALALLVAITIFAVMYTFLLFAGLGETIAIAIPSLLTLPFLIFGELRLRQITTQTHTLGSRTMSESETEPAVTRSETSPSTPLGFWPWLVARSRATAARARSTATSDVPETLITALKGLKTLIFGTQALGIDTRLAVHILQAIAYHALVMVGIYLLLVLEDFLFARYISPIPPLTVANTWMKGAIGILVAFSGLIQALVLLWQAFSWSLWQPPSQTPGQKEETPEKPEKKEDGNQLK